MFFSDAHCDTIERLLNTGEALGQNSGHIDAKRMVDINLRLQYFAAWVDPKFEKPFERANDIIKKFHLECADNFNLIAKIRSDADFDDGKINAVLTIEGGSALEGSLENLKIFYDMGVRLMTLTWNGTNEIGSGALDLEGNLAEPAGLTDFGREVVREMERLGMIIDVSHLSERGFWDVLKETKDTTPIFATHSNAKAIADHPRNLSDKQIEAIIARKGFIGLNFYPVFLGGDQIGDIVRHAEHILSLGGEDALGLGADFDGVDKLPKNVTGIESLPLVAQELADRLGKEQMEKITGENLWLTTCRCLCKM